MNYAGLKKNDIVDGEKVCVSYWAQGCPFHCKGCHNPETWDFNGGIDIDEDKLLEEILDAIEADGIKRNLSILGGEPLCEQNIDFTLRLMMRTKEKYPDVKIFVWTGYTLEQLKEKYQPIILNYIDVLIDGPFILEQRDLSLKLRGSKNQKIHLKNIDF